jgi:hypothetical protein
MAKLWEGVEIRILLGHKIICRMVYQGGKKQGIMIISGNVENENNKKERR